MVISDFVTEISKMAEECAPKYVGKYWHRFGESLYSLRNKESSDVFLECGKRIFYAHKVILIASSPYFRRMFQNGLNESKPRRITFAELDNFCLDVVLDFIYLQEVTKIENDEQLKRVMVAAQLLELDALFEYCVDELASNSSAAVFIYLFMLIHNHKKEYLKNTVRQLWNEHSRRFVSDRYFLSLPVVQIQDLIIFLEKSRLCLDYMILGILKWVKQDLDQRNRFARSLLESLGTQLVSKDCIHSLYSYPELVTLSQNISNAVSELGWCVLLRENSLLCKQNPTAGEFFGATTRLLFLCQNQNAEVFYPDKNCAKPALKQQSLCIQQLNLDRMEWLPRRNVDFNCEWASICQHGHFLHMACGKYLNYAVYDLEKNVIEQFNYNHLTGMTDVGICSFKGNIFIIGGCTKNCWITAVHYTKPYSGEWHKAPPLICASSEPYVLTTSYNIFVLTYNYKTCDISVEYNSDPASGTPWEIMYIHKSGALTCSSFLISNNILQALYVDLDGDVMHVIYDRRKKQMEAKKLPGLPSGCTAVTRVCPSLDNHLMLVCLSHESNGGCGLEAEVIPDRGDVARHTGKERDTFHIPNYLWNPDNGSWIKINLPTGRCDGKFALSSLICIL